MAAYAAAACRRALNLRAGSVGTRFYCSSGSVRKCEGNVLDSAHKIKSDAGIMRDKSKIGEEAQRFVDTKDELEEYRRLLKAAEKELGNKVWGSIWGMNLLTFTAVWAIYLLPPIK